MGQIYQHQIFLIFSTWCDKWVRSISTKFSWFLVLGVINGSDLSAPNFLVFSAWCDKWVRSISAEGAKSLRGERGCGYMCDKWVRSISIEKAESYGGGGNIIYCDKWLRSISNFYKIYYHFFDSSASFFGPASQAKMNSGFAAIFAWYLSIVVADIVVEEHCCSRIA